MSTSFMTILEVEGTAEEHKLILDYVPRKGDDLVIDFYQEEIIRYRVKQVIVDITIANAFDPLPSLPTQFRVIVEEMSG